MDHARIYEDQHAMLGYKGYNGRIFPGQWDIAMMWWRHSRNTIFKNQQSEAIWQYYVAANGWQISWSSPFGCP